MHPSRFIYLFVLFQHTVNVIANSKEIVELSKCCDQDGNGRKSCRIIEDAIYKLSSKVFSNSGKNLMIPVKLRETFLTCENRTEFTFNLSELVNSTKKWSPGRNNFTGFSKDGKFIHLKNVYDSDEFCISSISEKELSIIFCNQTCSPSRPCITRCCDYGSTWDFGNKLRCIPSGQKDWTPTYYSNVWDKSKLPNVPNGIRPILIYNHPRFWCNQSFAVQMSLKKPNKVFGKHLQKPYKILDDGSVWIKLRRRQWVRLKEGTYCIDGVVKFPGDNKTIEEGYSGLEEDSLLIDCDPARQEPEGYSGSSSFLYGSAVLISSIFFLLTAIVFILLRDKQTIHSWTSLGYIVAMMFTFHTLAFNQFSSLYMTREGDVTGGRYFTFCSIMGMFGHFSFLSAFLWLTMVNFDIWWTFRFLKPGPKSLKRLWIYMSIAFLVPTIIVGTGITLDLIYRNDPFSDIIIPDYGKTRCYMERRLAPLPYMYTPVSTMLATNLLFFISTAISIYKAKKATDFASSSSTKNEKSGQSLKLFGKLLFIMGIPWIWDVISWTLEGSEKDLPWYLIVGDLLTISQSVLVFIIFVIKKETLNSLSAKYPQFKRFVNSVTKLTRRIAKWTKMVNPCCARLKKCGLKGNESSEAHTTGSSITVDFNNSKIKNEVNNSTKVTNLQSEVPMSKRVTTLRKQDDNDTSNPGESIEMENGKCSWRVEDSLNV